MTETTFFWHDYETFGIDPQRDRVCQFAGIRTDTDFNVVGEPVMAYCQPTLDYLPHPEACLITGITPQHAAANGVTEARFAAIVHDELIRPNSCALGYNSLRFDDEVTRNLLYRNFYDPYAREWQNGNSRWDMIDVVRATHALRPDGINWPLNGDGVVTFRLEELTKANDISHQAAHDALSDVYATIAMARLIKQRQPKLFQFLFDNRGKNAVQQLLQLGSFTPLVHVSGRFPARNNCLAIVVPLCEHPTKSNEVIVYDLSVSPEPLLALSAADIMQRVFTAANALPEGVDRIPLKTIHINKAPVLAPVSVIKTADAERLGLDMSLCAANLQRIKAASGLNSKLAEVFDTRYATTNTDPELMIYSGGFFGNHDKGLMAKIRSANPEKLAGFAAGFDDNRLPEMLFRYRARNFPATLRADEALIWQEFCFGRLHEPAGGGGLNIDSYRQKILELRSTSADKQPILGQLEEWGVDLLSACALNAE